MSWSVVVLVALVAGVAFLAWRANKWLDGPARAAMNQAREAAATAAEERARAAVEVSAQSEPQAQAAAVADASNAVGMVEAQSGDLGAQASTVAGLIGAGLPGAQDAPPAAKVAP